MKKLFIPILLTAIFENAFCQNTDIEELTKLNQKWLNTYLTKDTTTLSRIFSDDFVLISPTGSKMTKHDIISRLNKQETTAINIDSINVRLLTSDVGLITAYITFALKENGKDMTGQNCYQDVYVKRKDQWYAVAAHVTLLGMK